MTERPGTIHVSGSPVPAAAGPGHQDLSGVLLVIPALNEEQGLPDVLSAARGLGVATLLLDGGSTDRTHAIAEASGIEVLHVSRGKGRGWCDFLDSGLADGWPHIAMVDADDTYDLSGLPGLVAAGADMAIGVRRPVGRPTPPLRAAGARALSWLAGALSGAPCADLLSGFRVMSTETLRQVRLTSGRFGLESELTIEYIRRGFRIAWVPVLYRRRQGESKLRPFTDGWDVLGTILRARYRKLS